MAKKWEIIYWWILRAVMVAAFIDSVFVRKDVQQSLQTAANLLLMFLWEIFMIFPERVCMESFPSGFSVEI